MTSYKDKPKKTRKTSISRRMLSSTLFFTVVPLIVTGALIIFTYQDLIKGILSQEGTKFTEETLENISLSLQNANIQAILTVFIVIVLTLFSNILMSRNLTRPLRKLVKGTQEVTKGNLDYQIKVESQDEIGELSTRFNQMTKELRKTKQSLEESKKGLEEKVKERTKELEKVAEELEDAKTALKIKVEARTRELRELTDSLEKQVEERTKQLQGKVQELEKFRKFAVGREVKMVELKKKVKHLQRETEE